jgi:hypothetical protein
MGVFENGRQYGARTGYRKEAERYAELASSGQRDITNFVHKRLAERFSRLAEDLERLGSERTRRHLLYGE